MLAQYKTEAMMTWSGYDYLSP